MEQPNGFIDFQFPQHVFRLKKALYSLKQASRACFQRLNIFLLVNRFTCSRVGTSLFIFKHDTCFMYHLGDLH